MKGRSARTGLFRWWNSSHGKIDGRLPCCHEGTPARRRVTMKDLSSGSIPGHIATMSIQMAIGILVQTLYFFTDLYFMSKCGDAAIAGLTSAGNIWFVVLALTQILNVGTVALVSHSVGAQQRDRANLVFNQSLSLSMW